MMAAAIVGPRQIEIRPVAIPDQTDGSVLVAPYFVGLCGTDRELYIGDHSYIANGLARLPFVPGHEWVGRVVACGSAVVDLRVGDTVVGDPFVACGACSMCRRSRRNLCERRSEIGVRGLFPGALAEYLRVPERNCTPVPRTLDKAAAILAEPAVTVLRGIERTNCGVGDSVLVVGAGTLGLIAVMVLTRLGANVAVADVAPPAVAAAVGLGARESVASDLFDVVIDTSGAAAGATIALRSVAPGGRIALLGMPSEPIEADVTRLVANDVEIHAVLGGVEQYALSMSLLESGVIQPDALLGARYAFADAARAFDDLDRSSAHPPKRFVEVHSISGGDVA